MRDGRQTGENFRRHAHLSLWPESAREGARLGGDSRRDDPCSGGTHEHRRQKRRREVGVIVRATPIVKDIERIFEDDWQRAGRK
jgi:hypothetical protein